MASSIISRQQGVLTSSNDTSAILQAGITQMAFRRLIDHYSLDVSVEEYEEYLKKSVDSVAGPVSNATRDLSFPLDRLSTGTGLIKLYMETGNATYRRAFEALRQSITLNKRNAEGGLWYFVYPEWSYLDGMFSLAPFYTLYTAIYDKPHSTAAMAEIFLQLELLWQHCRDNTTGLLFHGYDESKTAVWANPVTGASPHVWGRSLGWYAMALVDTLELLPLSHHSKQWQHLRGRFRQLSNAVVEAVDPASGAWWQLLDQPGRAGNYIESSGSAMFVYSLLKGDRLGYLENGAYAEVATRAYGYITNTFVVHEGNGTLGYNGTVSVCSLNSTASYEYYVGRPIVYNSVLGSAAFILASIEYESYFSK
ncbi:Six-hairpin glycosidase-like protein [Mycena rebaudengoi]|nr:Six-hairpin glycosidase-like protein [Mycena rebaudengoi]